MAPESKPGRLAEMQKAFAGHIRDPDRQPAPEGVENRRMNIYRELFFNNIQSLLASNFPVLRQLYDDDGWRVLVRDFYASHRCQTPLFPEVAREFLRYLQDERGERESDPAFLLELAHYEWVELALFLDEREPGDLPCDPQGDLLEGIPLLSPLAWPLSYRFPVHRIRPDFQPSSPPEQPSHLLAYRDGDGRVKFMELNHVSLALLGLMKEYPNASGRELLEQIARQIDHPEPDKVIEKGAQLLNDLKSKDVLLGTREPERV